MTAVRIGPVLEELSGTAQVPYSKPHMQRALLLSLLSSMPSVIMNPAWSSESESLLQSVQEFGLNVDQRHAQMLHLSGAGKSLGSESAKVSIEGSAFNFRTMAAVACLSRGETILEGNASMLTRPVREYLSFIPELGAALTDMSDDTQLRVRIRGSARFGGKATVDTQHSSQILTGVLLIAPLAEEPVRIDCTSAGHVGEGYIGLTVSMMREQGARIESDGTSFLVHPGPYQAGVHHMASDFTALSYLAGAVATAPQGSITVTGYYPSDLSSEGDFLEVLEKLGIRAVHDPLTRSLHMDRTAPIADKIEIDGRNIPTVVPTLAAIAPFVEAKVSLRNATHVNNHKCRRLDVMIHELTRMGCVIKPTFDADGRVDGFTTHGRQTPIGGVALDSHGDHRIFMSLATAALGAARPSPIDGMQHLHASFPGFLDTLKAVGVPVATGIDADGSA